MDTLIRNALKHYKAFAAEASLSEATQTAIRDEYQIKRIHLARARADMVQNWLQLLTYDERFVVEKHLIEGLEWARVVHAYMKHWDDLFIRSDRQLGSCQADALRKITNYCNTYPQLISELFDERHDRQRNIITTTRSKKRPEKTASSKTKTL